MKFLTKNVIPNNDDVMMDVESKDIVTCGVSKSLLTTL